MTGLEAAKIDQAAREFATQPKALAIWAVGQPDSVNGIYHQLVFAALNALKGNVKPNGLVSLAPGVPLANLPPIPERRKRRTRELGTAFTGSLRASVRAGSEQPIQMLLVHEANPLYSMPETKLFEEALRNVPTLVSFSFLHGRDSSPGRSYTA